MSKRTVRRTLAAVIVTGAAIAITLNLLVGLAGVFHQDVVEHLLEPLVFLEADQDFRGAAAHAAERLMNHDARVGQCTALALPAGCQKE